MGVQVPLEKPVSQSFGYIPKSGIAGSYGRSMFSFLSSLQILEMFPFEGCCCKKCKSWTGRKYLQITSWTKELCPEYR
jgi:hypothetical protein